MASTTLPTPARCGGAWLGLGLGLGLGLEPNRNRNRNPNPSPSPSPNQATREKTMEAFRNGRFRVLVAPDVAARGLDMRVDLVIQTKPPVGRFSAKPEVEI